MMSIVTFVIAFFIPTLGPIFLGGRNGTYNIKSSVDISLYFIERPEVVYTICFISLIICNIYLLVKNSTKNRLFKITYSETEQTFIFNLYSWYSNHFKTIKIHKRELFVNKTEKVNHRKEKSFSIEFIKGKYGNVFTKVDFVCDYYKVNPKTIYKAISVIEDITHKN